MRELKISRSGDASPWIEMFGPRKEWLPGLTSGSKASSSKNKAKV